MAGIGKMHQDSFRTIDDILCLLYLSVGQDCGKLLYVFILNGKLYAVFVSCGVRN